MENLQFTKEMRNEIVDLSAFNYCVNNEPKIEEHIRDGQRTSMQWNSTEINSRFTNACKAYLPLSKSWKTINIENQLKDSRSRINLFKQLIKLRENPSFYGGKYKLILANKQIYSFIRWLNKSISIPIYLVVINMIGASRNDPDNEYVKIDFIQLLKCKNKKILKAK
ncbi:unnamed protein product [Rotaria sp. Silwood2]|nr:unnamed protein product [Rotaria sp. Silwood2]CAF3201868.1 unnamed protein product [Rotaria sp. Silwood2]CAF4043021.1 unnamed protein product [Rotaria sp. Silwood2]CAF4262223.1 unnamed protein product [Rotaria sp. Silwood2]